MLTDHLIAHRGWQNRYPENTLIAIEQAIAKGACHIEIDIQLSADHTPWLYHDSDLRRVSDTAGIIHKCSDQQLMQLTAFEPKRLGGKFADNPLCSLQQCVELLKQHPDITLYVEIKKESVDYFGSAAVLDAILPRLSPIENQCKLISFSLPALWDAKQQGCSQLVPVLSNWKQLLHTELTQLEPELVFCNWKRLPDEYDLHVAPYKFAFYEVDNLTHAKHLLDRGASLIETFCVGELLDEHAETSR